jgi:hypothetical protein
MKKIVSFKVRFLILLICMNVICVLSVGYGLGPDAMRERHTGENCPNVAPAAPTGLQGEGTTMIKLTWSDNSSNETNFKVQRSLNGTTGWATIATLGVNRTSYLIAFVGSSRYYYRVAAVGAEGISYSNTTGLWPAFVHPPKNLQLTVLSPFQIHIAWSDKSNNETQFRVERSVGTNAEWLLVANVLSNDTATVDTGLMPSTTYYYRVRAENSAHVSEFTFSKNATTSSVSGICADVLQYLPRMNTKPYAEGSVVQNLDHVYECKAWPFSNWCNRPPHFSPGTGFLWSDAWILLGRCETSTGVATIAPVGQEIENADIISEMDSRIISVPVTENSKRINVQISDANGIKISDNKVMVNVKNNAVYVVMPEVPEGLYFVRVQSENKTWVKKYWIKK